MAKTEKGLTRGGIGGQEGERSNNIAPEGNVGEEQGRRQEGGAAQGGLPRTRPRNPFMDEESQSRLDRETQLKHELP